MKKERIEVLIKKVIGSKGKIIDVAFEQAGDAGVNVGLFFLKASVYARQVIALEPFPLCYKLLEFNLMKNKVKNVIPLNLALWKKRGKLCLLEGEHSATSRVVEEKCKGILVKGITLEELIKVYGKIDLLKMDIEGSEFDVLMSASSQVFRNIDHIVGEIHLWKGSQQGYNELIKKLKHNNFQVKVFNPPVFYYGYSLNKLLCNWKRLKGIHRLKVGLFLFYTAFNLGTRLKIIESNKFNNLRFLYAYKNK